MFIRKRSEKTGLPPGSLVYVGEEKTEKVRITFTGYNKTHYLEKELENIQDISSLTQPETVAWIHICGLHEPKIIEDIGNLYQLNSLILEDVLNTFHRPKLEDCEDCIFTVLHTFYYDLAEESVITEQLSLVLGPDYVISFQEGTRDIFESVRKRLRTARGRSRNLGADYLAYALMDTVIDNYFNIIDIIDDRIEDVEEKLFTDFSQDLLQEIHELKSEIIYLRKSVLPVRTLIGSLEKTDSELVSDDVRIFLRDLSDHVIHIADSVETFRETVAGLLEIYHSGISNRMNEVMKLLTIIATIFIPLTFIAGIYGMNFKYMPELEWKWGYLFIWSVIILAGVLMVLYFRKKKWL